MNHFSRTLVASCALSLFACDNDPVKDAPHAQTSAPIAEVEKKTQEDPASSLTLPVNSSNSTLNFVGAKVTDKHAGSFEKLEGSIELVDGDPAKSSVSIRIAMDSLSIEPKKLDGHLRGEDFFDIEKFPEAKFVSTSIEKSGKGKYQVTGNLTLHGVTKAIVFPATIEVDDRSVSVDAKFGINRKDFGIVYPGMPDDLIKDEVLIDLALSPKES